ncbi:glutaminase [Lutibacter holmesii]|uniref:Glutaminase n=1 Tax=Lutibacter holmesii TaxID=1137985 RepID=A0ABW3WQT1_9FLAO
MEYQALFLKINNSLKGFQDSGQVANYIPELAKVDANKFGVHLTTIDHKQAGFGDDNEKFSIQSIAKVLALTLAYTFEDEILFKRVGVEPSGTPFNSLYLLETDQGIPRNPLINAGAIVVCDVLMSHLKNPKADFLKFVQTVSGNSAISYCERIVTSEKSCGYRNMALVNLMKTFGNIKNKIDDVMDFYFNLCSIQMTCNELSKTFLFLANDGFCPVSNKVILSPSKSKRINSVMQSCGFYDEAGEFSFKVGLPGKSGVGGGIVAVHPGKYSIAVWSPKLNKKGNSNKGIAFLERFTTETDTSIF